MQAVYRPTELTQLTADLVSVFRSACQKASLRLIFDGQPLSDKVFVDTDMWEKVLERPVNH